VAASGTWDGSTTSGDAYETGNHWSFGSTFRNPQAGDILTVNSGVVSRQGPNAGSDLILSSTSGDGASLGISGGEVDTVWVPGGNWGGSGLVVDTGGSLAVSGAGLLNTGGGMTVGAGSSGSSSATFNNNATINIDTALNGGTNPTLYDGLFGYGIITQSGNATVNGSHLSLGDLSGSTGIYNLLGGQLNMPNEVSVGGSTGSAGGTGTMSISGGTLSTGSLQVWGTTGALVDVSGGSLSVSGSLSVAGSYIQSGGSVSAGSADFSGASSFSFTGGSITVTGGAFKPLLGDVQWDNGYGMQSVTNGHGNAWQISSDVASPALYASGGATVGSLQGATLVVGNSGGSGSLYISGAGTSINQIVTIGIGGSLSGGVYHPGNGLMMVTGGVNLQAEIGDVGLEGGEGTLLVSGAGTTLTVAPGAFGVGDFAGVPGSGSGTLEVESGAVMSVLNDPSALTVGTDSSGAGGHGYVFVDGANSRLTLTNSSFGLWVGTSDSGSTTSYGSVSVTNGGAIQSTWDVLGSGSGGLGSATITGSGSTWSDALMYIGNSNTTGPASTLIVSSGGTLTTTRGVFIFDGGRLNLESGGTINAAEFDPYKSSYFNWTGGTLSITDQIYGYGPANPTSIAVPTSGKLIFEPSTTHVTTLGGLSIASGGVVDLSNNHIFISYGSNPDPISTIQQYLLSGFNGGQWNGSTGIISSTAAVTPGYGVGYADSADPGNPAGLSSGTIEVAYVLLGDANLDGTVNGVDFGILAANFNHGVSRWDQGDFNYDGAVNGVDFGELAANFNQGASGASAPSDSVWGDPAIVAFAEANGLMADLPEPGVVGISIGVGVGLLGRRRRSPGGPVGRAVESGE
jgi:hypothetical protein